MNESNAELLVMAKENLLKTYQALPKEIQEQYPEIPQKIQEMKKLSEVGKPLQAVKQYLPPLKK